jgi:hypothetical protein
VVPGGTTRAPAQVSGSGPGEQAEPSLVDTGQLAGALARPWETRLRRPRSRSPPAGRALGACEDDPPARIAFAAVAGPFPTAEQADDPPIRRARDATVNELVGIMTRLRSTVEDALGREALTTYGLQGDTPRVPRKSLHHAQNVARLLKKFRGVRCLRCAVRRCWKAPLEQAVRRFAVPAWYGARVHGRRQPDCCGGLWWFPGLWRRCSCQRRK